VKTIHLIYPHGNVVSAPNSIGRNLGKRLSELYNVLYYDIQGIGLIIPGNNDILLGHAWPTMSLFRRSLQQSGWNRVILLQPYCHGDYQDAFVDLFINKCDLFLAITGNYWFNDIKYSKYKHWLPKMRHIDLAINRRDFSVIKYSFNPPGKRKFVYIGSNKDYKNIGYLSRLAQELFEYEFAWIGVKERIPYLKSLGCMDFSKKEAKDLLSQYDFMITVGKADGNPTTILESMGWGLIPICTPQSGYEGFSGIPNIPLDRPKEAAAILRELQLIDEVKLLEMQQKNWHLLDTHFNWERFTQDVVDAIESRESPACLPLSKTKRIFLFYKSLKYPRLDSWPLLRKIGKKAIKIIKKKF